MTKICYIDFWMDRKGCPVKTNEINDVGVWEKSELNRELVPIDKGVGIVHFDYLKSFLPDLELVRDPRNADLLICSIFGNLKRYFPEKKKLILIYEQDYFGTEMESIPNSRFITTAFLNPNVFHINLYFLYRGFDLYTTLKEPRKKNKPNRKFCLSIVSNNKSVQRNIMMQLISGYKQVDHYGAVLKNASDELIEKTCWYDPRLLEKISHYKFMICMENFSKPRYYTEKIINGFLGNTIPIYWGDPDIENVFNPDAFINVGKLGIRKALEMIEYLDTNEDAYKNMLLKPPIVHNRYEEFMDESCYHQFIRGFLSC